MKNLIAVNLRPDGMNAAPQIEFDQARAEALTGDQVGFRVRWLSNTYDPEADDAFSSVERIIGQTQTDAWESKRDWLKNKIIGNPKATDTYTVEQLQQMKMVGVYVKIEPEELRGTVLDAILSEDSQLKAVNN